MGRFFVPKFKTIFCQNRLKTEFKNGIGVFFEAAGGNLEGGISIQ